MVGVTLPLLTVPLPRVGASRAAPAAESAAAPEPAAAPAAAPESAGEVTA
jgi:hypothetical protein